jgi:hypothetical protein
MPDEIRRELPDEGRRRAAGRGADRGEIVGPGGLRDQIACRGVDAGRRREVVVGLIAPVDLGDGVIDRGLRVAHVDQVLHVVWRREADRLDGDRVPAPHGVGDDGDVGDIGGPTPRRHRCRGLGELPPIGQGSVPPAPRVGTVALDVGLARGGSDWDASRSEVSPRLAAGDVQRQRRLVELDHPDYGSERARGGLPSGRTYANAASASQSLSASCAVV